MAWVRFSAAVPWGVFAWEKYRRAEVQKTQTHAKPVQLCKHVVKPRIPKGKKAAWRQRSAAGVWRRWWVRARDKERASGAAPDGAQNPRGAAVPGPSNAAVQTVSSLRRRPSSCHPSGATGPNLGHLKSRRPPPVRIPKNAWASSCWAWNRAAAAAGLQTARLAPMRRRRLSPRPSGSLRTACPSSRPPVRGRAPSRHLPGPTPSQRPPALGPSAEAALPPVRGLKWLRNKENLGSGKRRSDWTGGGARRGNVRRRSPWQRRRGWGKPRPGDCGA